MNLLTSYTSLRKERERKREREREESQNIEPFCPCERFHRMLDPAAQIQLISLGATLICGLL